MRGRTALVTGARGFAGAWLSRALLEEGATVVGYDRSGEERSSLRLLGIAEELEVVRGDLRDEARVMAAMGERRVDVVFHLGAQTLVGEASADPRETLETNVRGTWHVLEACRRHEVGALVIASSDKAYGPHEELPYREAAPLRPIYPYDASKAIAELVARSYSHTYGLPVAATRFANLYGGGDLNFSRLIPETVAAALDGRRPVIRSDGSPERDFLYVEDAAGAYLAIVRALDAGEGRGEAFNAGGGRPHSVREVVELALRVAGAEVEPEFRGDGVPPGEISRQYLDSTRLRELTGWAPAVNLEEGLRRTVAWYREHPEARPPAP